MAVSVVCINRAVQKTLSGIEGKETTSVYLHAVPRCGPLTLAWIVAIYVSCGEMPSSSGYCLAGELGSF